MGNPFEDLRQAVVVRPMNSPGPQGAAGPEVKIKYSFDGLSWHDTYMEHDKYIRFSTDNGVTWSNAIYFNNLAETLEWVERARQWAENPENDPVITPDQYSALHHASRAARSEENAEAAALDAELAAIGAFGVPPAPWNSTTVYNYNDIVNFGNGHIYRCIGTNIVGADHAPNIDGIDNDEDWIRITVVLDGYFEVDENGDFMPMIAPTNSEIFMLDENSDITYQDPIELDASRATIELFTLDENGDIAYRDPTDHRPGGGNIELYKEIEFVDSIADFRSSSFYGTTKYVYVAGYYGAGTPGGGMFYRDPNSLEADNSGTIIVDGDGVRWKRANVHEEYYASWFGVSTEVEDNSPLIQNALNALPRGGILIFGPGRYYCKQTIVFPEIPQYWEEGISIQGASKIPSYQSRESQTMLHYVGPNPDTLTPFFDFRCRYPSEVFRGSIRNIGFIGLGMNSNIVGLWFNTCAGSLLESVYVDGFKYGIQINKDYYYCKFNDVLCIRCDYGFRTLSIGNGAVFNYCNFRFCNVGFGHNLNNGPCTGVYFNACYFEVNNVAIQSMTKMSLHINQCYFENHKEYAIEILGAGSSLIVLENSLIHISFDATNLTSNKAFIKQITGSRTISLVLNNNIISNDTHILDYFVYVASGNINIKAENNKFTAPSRTLPLCSKTPSQQSYFNNDFS